MSGHLQRSDVANLDEMEDSGYRAARGSAFDGISRSIFVARWPRLVSRCGLRIAERRRPGSSLPFQRFKTLGIFAPAGVGEVDRARLCQPRRFRRNVGMSGFFSAWRKAHAALFDNWRSVLGIG